MNKRISKRAAFAVVLAALIVVLLLMVCVLGAAFSGPPSYERTTVSEQIGAPSLGQTSPQQLSRDDIQRELDNHGKGRSSGPFGGDIAKIVAAVASLAPVSLPGTSGQCQMPGDGFGPDVPYCQ